MRNLYQPSSHQHPNQAHNSQMQHQHHHSYPGQSHSEPAQFVENHSNHSNQPSPKIIPIHHRSSQPNSPSACFINKQNFFQNHHQQPQFSNHSSSKPKTVFTVQTNNYLNQSQSQSQNNSPKTNDLPLNDHQASLTNSSTKSPYLSQSNSHQHHTKIIKPHKLSSSSSLSSTSSISFLNSTSSNTQSDLYAANSINTDLSNLETLDSQDHDEAQNSTCFHENTLIQDTSSSKPPMIGQGARTGLYTKNQHQKFNSSSVATYHGGSHSPIVMSFSSSSSSSSCSSPSPVMVPSYQTPSKCQQDQQNERFFESNTLYKKELKQKQRDILSSSASSIQSSKSNQMSILNQSPPVNLFQNNENEKFNEENGENLNLSRSNEKRLTLPPNPSSNKMFNLFTSFLSRSNNGSNSRSDKSDDSILSKSVLSPNSSANNNGSYMNLKNLKRATSSTHFNSNTKFKSPELSQSSATSDPTTTTAHKSSIFNTSSIFNGSKLSRSNLTSTKQSIEHIVKPGSSGKYRRSFDDVAKLAASISSSSQLNTRNSQNDNIISLDKNKFENTAFSTKNNGLIFLPHNSSTESTSTSTSTSSESSTSSEPLNPDYENLDDDDVKSKSKSKTGLSLKLSTSANKLSKYIQNPQLPVKLIVNDLSSPTSTSRVLHSPNQLKPSEEILKRINSLTSSSSTLVKQQPQKHHENEDLNAFDNVVYSYVDNIRQHSKRLSEISLLNQTNAIAAASAAAAAAVVVASGSANVEPKTTDWNKSLNSLSCLSSSSSSSSSGSSSLASNNSFHSSTSPKSTETVNTNVMSLRDKFEQFKSNGELSCNTESQTIGSAKLKPHSLPIMNQFSSEKNQMSLVNKCASLSDNLLVNTNSNLLIAQNNVPNSPALSSVSTSSSHSSSSSSSTSCSSVSLSREIQTTELDKTQCLNANNKEIHFNFYYEFYKFNSSGNEEEKFKQNKIYASYENNLSLFLSKFFSNNVCVRSVFDPILVDYSTCLALKNSYYKFTIEFFRPILVNKLFNVVAVSCDNLNTQAFESEDFEFDLELENNSNFDLNQNVYNFLLNEISCLSNNENLNSGEFEFLKKKIKFFIQSKLSYFNDELRMVQKSIDFNDKIGSKILKDLENYSSIKSLELDKYKLLVSESDVITNLLLKLCNKIANAENSIQFMQLKQVNSCCSANDFSHTAEATKLKFSNEEIDLLKQELNQIHRKKEEALFLKNGIDKRSSTVSDFLLNYLNQEQFEEFESFMKMKLVNALKQRHLKDHIELAQLQLKLLNDLYINRN